MLLVVLMGAAAIAVDVGALYAEKAQLQNGADSAALAIADDCAGGSCGDFAATGDEFANTNANDGSSGAIVTFPNATTVRVATNARDANTDADSFSLFFARILGFETTEVGAIAEASWGPPGSGGAFPLAFSDKCWDLSGAVDTGQLQKISWKPGVTCTNPSGHTIPGGWGWLDDPDSDCYAVTGLGNAIGSDPGNNKPTQCATILQGWINVLNSGDEVNVLFPVFDTATGSGNTGSFHIIGFATFSIVGWKFGQNGVYEYHNTTAALGNSHLACSGGNDRCIIGQFIKFQSIDSVGGVGGGADLGTLDIRLTK
ncbi:TadE/TadG family type IV pilus assembly protein [Arthrobacter sp. CJ23]|uniref:TadE/TadG family type IV pilus assembly protein n=1 Tax=Arthrobacter sp. CJ23 TaxID=2972479 RepID=UPI00215CE72B|nr:TadE/TadG family type IV pilus assembly protein [Arthrobacter sp. CJ23]UVJ41652.1 pilus assembly protein TadG-related protein [Arthrobacter sp. CJ23]